MRLFRDSDDMKDYIRKDVQEKVFISTYGEKVRQMYKEIEVYIEGHGIKAKDRYELRKIIETCRYG